MFFDSQYKITTGFFTENTIIVAEGEMLSEGIFKVSVIFNSLSIFFFLNLLMLCLLILTKFME